MWRLRDFKSSVKKWMSPLGIYTWWWKKKKKKVNGVKRYFPVIYVSFDPLKLPSTVFETWLFIYFIFFLKPPHQSPFFFFLHDKSTIFLQLFLVPLFFPWPFELLLHCKGTPSYENSPSQDAAATVFQRVIYIIYLGCSDSRGKDG